MYKLILPKMTVPVEIEPTESGQLLITDDDRIRFKLAGDDLPAALRAWADSLDPPQPRGLIPALKRLGQHFTRITIDDLKPEMSSAEQIALTIIRFESAGLVGDDVINALKDDYRRVAGHSWEQRLAKLESADDDQLDELRRHAAELFDEAGQPVWGAQRKIAEILGFPSTGGSFRPQILDYMAQLQKIRQAA